MKQYPRWMAVVIAVGVFALCGTTAADIPSYVDYHAVWDKDTPDDPPDWKIVKDIRGYGELTWVDNIDILVPNQYVPELIKYVWVEVEWDWGTPDYPIDVYLYAGINDPPGGDVVIEPYPGSPKQNVAGDGWTYCWTIDPQPNWEQIHFTSDDYRLLENGVERVEVGTYCIPEPTSLTIWSLTGLAFAAVLWRHRKSSLSN